MKLTRPDSALERLLLALEQEVVEATDEEVLAAARELGMNPTMKGSSAFTGVTMVVHWPSANRVRSWLAKADGEKGSGSPRRRPKGDTPI
jgi:hypothetical protein